jgi:hypothetical protein
MRLVLLFLLPLSSFGQNLFKGIVINKETRQGVAFATVGLVKQNIGTNSDEKGSFSLYITSTANDTLIFSSIGYETLKVALNKNNPNAIFELKPKTDYLKEVIVVSNYNWKSVILGQYSNCGSHYYTVSYSVNQVARHFKVPMANTLLKEIEICKYGIAIIDPARTKFRIRIYSMDSITNQPLNDLCDSIIELDVTGRHIKVNLEKYNIMLHDKDFFVAVEWLRIPMNEEKNNKSSYGGKHKVKFSTFSPLLAIKDKTSDNEEFKSWILDYSGKWRPISWTAMISATVKY